MPDEKVIVVTQEAIYLHAVFGPFDTFEDAARFADEQYNDPCEDHHHRYVVRTLPLDGGDVSNGLYATESSSRTRRHSGICRRTDAAARVFNNRECDRA